MFSKLIHHIRTRATKKLRIAIALSSLIVAAGIAFGITSSLAATAGTTQCTSTVQSTTGVSITGPTSNNCIAKFTSGTNQWTPPVGVVKARLLVVGGGAGGDRGLCSYYWGHGGGGGGVYDSGSANRISLTSSAKNIVVGDGGARNGVDCQAGNVGLPGSNSSFDGTYIATGGKIASNSTVGNAGAYGGSSGTVSTNGGTTYTASYSGGNGGGTGGAGCGSSQGYCGGGGGAGAGATGSGLNGGAGVTSDITGTSLMYGMGGGGRNDQGSGSAYTTAGVLSSATAGVGTSTYCDGAVNTGGGGGDCAPTGSGGCRWFGHCGSELDSSGTLDHYCS